jgi:hypothetical protein
MFYRAYNETPTKGTIMSGVFDDTTVTYEGSTKETIVLTAICGCTLKLLPGSLNQFGAPIQFRWECKEHFDW